MFKDKKIIVTITIFLVIIIIGSIYAYYFFNLKKPVPETPVPSMTDAERAALLEKLGAGSEKPIPVEKRTKILKDLNSGSVQTNMTEEDRAKILESLND